MEIKKNELDGINKMHNILFSFANENSYLLHICMGCSSCDYCM